MASAGEVIAPPPPTAAPGGSRGAPFARIGAGGALAALLAVSSLVLLSWFSQRPPEPLPATAPATVFSAQRAIEHVGRIAREPTPVGAPSGDEVRAYLVDELSRLGLDVEVQEAVGGRTFGSSTVAGRVENVLATLPGHDATGQVLMVAHYDTTFGSPGASDDKSAVAALIETGRAVAAGGSLRNDLVLLLTDGEEPGMLGASAYVAAQGDGATPTVVLNWEAIGNQGPSMLFETAPDNAALVSTFAAVAPHPVGDSALAGMYRTSSQNTDFTVFREAGLDGLNFGLVDGTAYYHHADDTLAGLDRAAVQDHGDTMLALARALGDADLTTQTADHDATFFTAFGRVLTYSHALVWPLAVLASVLVALTAASARRGGLTTVPRLLLGVVASALPLVAAPAAAAGLWAALEAVRPGYDALFMGDPYRPALYRWALGMLTIAAVLAWYLLLRRRLDAVSLAIGALFWPTLLGLLTAGWLPDASHYGSLPTAAAATGLWAALALGPERPRHQVTALAVGLLPGALLLVPAALTLLGILGVALASVAVLLLALAGLLALPLLEVLVRPNGDGRRRGRPAVLVTVAAALVVMASSAGLAIDRFDDRHPRNAHLMYVLDDTTGAARWVTTDRVPATDWTADFVPHVAVSDGNLPLPYGARPARWGPAERMRLPRPRLRRLATSTNEDATVTKIRLTSPRDGDVLVLHADRPVEHVVIAVEGQPRITSTPEYAAEDRTRRWPYELRVYDPPDQGVEVTVRVAGPEPPTLSLADYTVGMERVPGFTPRPDHLVRSPDHTSDLVVVGGTHHP